MNTAGYNPFSAETLAQMRAKQQQKRQQAATKKDSVRNNGQPRPSAKSRPGKAAKVDFLTFDLTLLHKLRAARANSAVYAMVCALSETWFTTGFHRQHPNPLPLSRVNSANWQLTRKQKSRALRFLTQINLIAVDRRDPRNPLLTLNWAPLYPSAV